MTDGEKIIQIIPATGWGAEYENIDRKGDTITVPLAAWALTDDGQVIGLDASDYVEECNRVSNFNKYVRV